MSHCVLYWPSALLRQVKRLWYHVYARAIHSERKTESEFGENNNHAAPYACLLLAHHPVWTLLFPEETAFCCLPGFRRLLFPPCRPIIVYWCCLSELGLPEARPAKSPLLLPCWYWVWDARAGPMTSTVDSLCCQMFSVFTGSIVEWALMAFSICFICFFISSFLSAETIDL